MAQIQAPPSSTAIAPPNGNGVVAASSSSSSSSSSSKPSIQPSEVGWLFVPQYYTFLNQNPDRLHCFYTKKSTLIHGTEQEDEKPCFGQQVRVESSEVELPSTHISPHTFLLITHRKSTTKSSPSDSKTAKSTSPTSTLSPQARAASSSRFSVR